MKILGIETSCDETAAALAEYKNGRIKILSNVVSSQINIHKKYGGVVPELAAREHVVNILPIIHEALEQAKIKASAAAKALDGIAVSIGPGLITSLLVGTETAKTLGFAWQINTNGINHIEGHIYANFIERDIDKFKFPIIILTVSGGHTMLVLMQADDNFRTIGETRDDAAGEAFDKAAKLMELGYPGGPIISQYALQADPKKNVKIKLPRPMIDKAGFDFSFSGLKTALFYELKSNKNWRQYIPEYAREFQQAAVDVLVSKTIKAGINFQAKTVMLAGGVAANNLLRTKLEGEAKKENFLFFMPELKYTTDNAAMIAAAGCLKYLHHQTTPWSELKVACNLEL